MSEPVMVTAKELADELRVVRRTLAPNAVMALLRPTEDGLTVIRTLDPDAIEVEFATVDMERLT